jgi:hypothetical protein
VDGRVAGGERSGRAAPDGRHAACRTPTVEHLDALPSCPGFYVQIGVNVAGSGPVGQDSPFSIAVP